MSSQLEPWDEDALWLSAWIPDFDEEAEDEFCESVASLVSFGFSLDEAREKSFTNLKKLNYG